MSLDTLMNLTIPTATFVDGKSVPCKWMDNPDYMGAIIEALEVPEEPEQLGDGHHVWKRLFTPHDGAKIVNKNTPGVWMWYHRRGNVLTKDPKSAPRGYRVVYKRRIGTKCDSHQVINVPLDEDTIFAHKERVDKLKDSAFTPKAPEQFDAPELYESNPFYEDHDPVHILIEYLSPHPQPLWVLKEDYQRIEEWQEAQREAVIPVDEVVTCMNAFPCNTAEEMEDWSFTPLPSKLKVTKDSPERQVRHDVPYFRRLQRILLLAQTGDRTAMHRLIFSHSHNMATYILTPLEEAKKLDAYRRADRKAEYWVMLREESMKTIATIQQEAKAIGAFLKLDPAVQDFGTPRWSAWGVGDSS